MRRSVLQWFVALIIWGLVVTALARPHWVEDPIEQIQSARDIMLAIDLSQSMEARDFVDDEGSRIDRLEAVKEVVDDFITKREGDRIGLVVYGGAAYPQVPFTLDHESVRILLAETEIGMAGPRTAIGDAIGLSIRLFEASEVEERVLILLTDGNDTGSKMPPDKAADIAASQGIVIHTIGIGSPEASGEEQVDLESLQEIAEATGGRAFRGEDQAGLQSIYSTLDEMTPKNYEVFSYRPKIPLFQWPLGAAVILLLIYELGMILWAAIPTRKPASSKTPALEGAQ
jgi:Ca-activated chloride channel family protein